jgi:ElaB/YqjD/DUF883 family membrane-anchored ribosome-binding protein
MEKTVTFEITESQMKKFETLLDEFNAAMKRVGNNEPKKDDKIPNIQSETHLLLAQAREEIKKIKQINSNREKMIWEQ